MNTIQRKVRELLDSGIYHQEEIFKALYPQYPGHYSRLRTIIAEEKDR